MGTEKIASDMKMVIASDLHLCFGYGPTTFKPYTRTTTTTNGDGDATERNHGKS
jgi:hypothetical protein